MAQVQGCKPVSSERSRRDGFGLLFALHSPQIRRLAKVMPNQTFTDACLANNARYADGFDAGGLPLAPKGKAAVVACMDARMDVGRLLGLTEGDAHVIRNAGGVVTDDALRSLIISQRLLGTEAIILIHHTDCGMMKFRDDDLKAAIEADTGIRPAFALEAFADLEAEVRQSIRRIKACPFIPVRDQVRGFVYEVETGRLNEVA